jgi:hypothetical protein
LVGGIRALIGNYGRLDCDRPGYGSDDSGRRIDNQAAIRD